MEKKEKIEKQLTKTLLKEQPVTIELYTYWLKNEAENLKLAKSTTFQKIMGSTGFSIGAISALMSARIAYEFGADHRGKAPSYVLGTFLGATTGITMSAGMIFMNYEFLRELARATPQTRMELLRKKTRLEQCSRGTYIVLLTLISTVASLYAAYLTDDRFSPDMHKATIILSLPTLIANTVVSYWSVDKQFTSFQNYLKKEFRTFKSKKSVKMLEMHNYLSKKFELIKIHIAKMSDVEISDLLNTLTQLNDTTQINGLDTLLALIKPQTTTQVMKESWGPRLFGYFGTIVGVVAPYFILSVTQEAGKWVCDFLNIHDEEAVNDFADAIAWTSFATAAALSALASQINFEKIYKAFSSAFCKSGGLKHVMDLETFIKFTLALSGTSYRLSLTLDALESRNITTVLIGICSVLGPFSVYYWGLDMTKHKLKGVTDRDKLNNLVMLMSKLLPEMNNTHLKALHTYVKTHDTIANSLKSVVFENQEESLKHGSKAISSGDEKSTEALTFKYKATSSNSTEAPEGEEIFDLPKRYSSLNTEESDDDESLYGDSAEVSSIKSRCSIM